MSEKFQNRYRIPSARAPWWQYGWQAAYFVTVCTANREHFFGHIHKGRVILSELGAIACQEWEKTPSMRPEMNIRLGEWIVMPNHFHAIVHIGQNRYNREALRGFGVDRDPGRDGKDARLLGTGGMAYGNRGDHFRDGDNGDGPNGDARSGGGRDARPRVSTTPGNNPNGNETTGNTIPQNNPNGNETTGNAIPQNNPNGNETTGNAIPQNNPNRNETTGNAIPQNNPNRNEPPPPYDPKPSQGWGKFAPQSQNLASIMRGFKSAVTTYARRQGIPFNWQTRYHDHIIRNEKEWHRISTYIYNNPLNWKEDRFFRK